MSQCRALDDFDFNAPLLWSEVFGFLALFLATLRNFYFPAFGGAVLSFSGALILIVLALDRVLSDGRIPRLYPQFMISFAFVMLAALHVTIIGSTEAFRGGIGLAIAAISFGSVAILFNKRLESLWRILSIILAVHLVSLAAQVVAYLFTGTYIDFVSISSDKSRWLSSKSFVVLGYVVPRFTGLFAEPGTYAGTVGAVVAARFFLSRRVDGLLVLSMGSLFITASLTGFILGFVVMAGILFEYARSMQRRRLRIIAITLVFVCSASIVLYNRLQARPFESLADDFAVRHFTWITGKDAASLIGVPTEELPEFFTVDYLGLWMSMYVRFGFMGLILLCFSGVRAARENIFLIVTVLLAKLQATFPLGLLIVGIMWIGSTSTSDKKGTR